jgi:hypothetical protein
MPKGKSKSKSKSRHSGMLGHKMLRNPILFALVGVLSIMNIIGYISRRDWNSVCFFALAAVITYYFSRNITVILAVALIATGVYRASGTLAPRLEGMVGGRREGLTDASLDDDEDEDVNAIQTQMGGNNMPNVSPEQLAKLQSQQEKMIKMAERMQPLVAESMKMIKSLPNGFLENGLSNMTKQKV